MMGDFSRRTDRLTLLLLAVVALLGLAHLSFLPPWEGADETAHWSYVQELADLGHGPQYGLDPLAKDLMLYPGPMPYGQVPPFERTGAPTYRSYRVDVGRPVAGGPTTFEPGAALNWQAQHPPLYYEVMAALYPFVKGFGWVNHLLALRLLSFGMAFSGFAIGVVATARYAARRGLSPWTGPIAAAWPLLFPQFIPEFARLGNDSLCLLLTGTIWAALLWPAQGKTRLLWSATIGVLLGLGLLTKALFLPMTAGVGLLLAARGLLRERSGAAFVEAFLAVTLALMIGAGWYLAKAHETGSWTGSDEMIRMRAAGGWPAVAKAFSLLQLARGVAALPATFAWTGTWSLARLPEVLLAAPVAMLGLTLAAYLRGLGKGRWEDWAPLAFALPVVAGLMVHVLVAMAGLAALTPGYYLHILAGPLGFAVSLGWRWPRLLGALAALTGLYTVAEWIMQISLFSGCAAKLGEDRHYTLAGSDCLFSWPALQALGHPVLGVACLVGASALGLAAVRVLRSAPGQFRPIPIPPRPA